jgi:hypothetical protein
MQSAIIAKRNSQLRGFRQAATQICHKLFVIYSYNRFADNHLQVGNVIRSDRQRQLYAVLQVEKGYGRRYLLGKRA